MKNNEIKYRSLHNKAIKNPLFLNKMKYTKISIKRMKALYQKQMIKYKIYHSNLKH